MIVKYELHVFFFFFELFQEYFVDCVVEIYIVVARIDLLR